MDQVGINCKIHKNKKAIFINIDQQNKILEYTCDQCTAQKNKKQKFKLLVLNELSSPDQNTILTNWPLLQSEDLLNRYDTIFQEFKNDKKKTFDLSQKVSKYFNSIIDKFTSKIKNIEKQILNSISKFSSEELLKTYNEVSQREKLLQYFGDQNNMECNLKNLIINIEKNCSEHERTLEQQCSKFEKFNNTFDEVNMKNYFEKVFKIIDEINSKEENSQQQINSIPTQQNPTQQPTQDRFFTFDQTNTNIDLIQQTKSRQSQNNISAPVEYNKYIQNQQKSEQSQTQANKYQQNETIITPRQSGRQTPSPSQLNKIISSQKVPLRPSIYENSQITNNNSFNYDQNKVQKHMNAQNQMKMSYHNQFLQQKVMNNDSQQNNSSQQKSFNQSFNEVNKYQIHTPRQIEKQNPSQPNLQNTQLNQYAVPLNSQRNLNKNESMTDLKQAIKQQNNFSNEMNKKYN